MYASFVPTEQTHDVGLAFDRLSPVERKILVFRYCLGLSQREAAEVIGSSRSYVGQVETRALRKLRRFFGVTAEQHVGRPYVRWGMG